MTRANLNFTYRVKGELKVLYHYHNGDQYPTGIRDFYHVLDLLKDFTPAGFTNWLGKNYTEAVLKTYGNDNGISMQVYEHNETPAKPTLQNHTVIGDLTDYTYVFNSNYGADYLDNTIQAYNWENQIFNGTLKEFGTWIKKQK